jgi:hypothetical protein
MVRRGSTVRVRQRALQNPRKPGLFVSDRFAGSRTWGRYGALYGAFRSKTPSWRAASPSRAQVRKRGPRFIARLGLSPFLLGVSPLTLCAHPASHLDCGPNPRPLELGQALPCALVRRLPGEMDTAVDDLAHLGRADVSSPPFADRAAPSRSAARGWFHLAACISSAGTPRQSRGDPTRRPETPSTSRAARRRDRGRRRRILPQGRPVHRTPSSCT